MTATGYDIVVLVDGDVLLVSGALSPTDGQVENPAVPGRDRGTLDAGEVANFLMEAVAGGFTFETLKAAVQTLVKHRQIDPPPVATVTDIRDAVDDYLRTSGYEDISLTEVRQVPGHGWSVEGQADNLRVSAIAEDSGRLVYVRVQS